MSGLVGEDCGFGGSGGRGDDEFEMGDGEFGALARVISGEGSSSDGGGGGGRLLGDTLRSAVCTYEIN